jgi:hypothetical protein
VQLIILHHLQVEYYSWKLENRYQRNIAYKVGQDVCCISKQRTCTVTYNFHVHLLLSTCCPPPMIVHAFALVCAVQGFALCHDAVVCWALTFQFLRLLQLAQHVFTVLK